MLVLGAGRVGSIAAELMKEMGADVAVYDVDEKRMNDLSDGIGVKTVKDLNEALYSHDLVFNASPGAIDGNHVKKGAVVSSPGIPFPFDGTGVKKVKMVIHDPLDIGVAVMAVQAASFSRLKGL